MKFSLLIRTGLTTGGNLVLDDANFQTAVNLWFDNQAEATLPMVTSATGMFLR